MIEVYRSTNTNYQKNGDITLTPLECIFEWGLDGICQIELTHEYDDLGRWEYLVNDNVIAAPTPYSDKQSPFPCKAHCAGAARQKSLCCRRSFCMFWLEPRPHAYGSKSSYCRCR